MKSLIRDLVLSLVLGFVLPGLVFAWGTLQSRVREEALGKQELSQTQPPQIRLSMFLREENGDVTQRDMDSYLLGVVLAEMPASFEPEALKAQAVAARNYTQKAYVTGGKHGDGSVCTAPGCCQAYIPLEDYKAKGGTEAAIEKVRTAVLETSGQVLLYEGELIEATYFSCSGGATEDAAAVWGTAYPYLTSVESPGEEEAPPFEDTVIFTPEAFCNALGVTLEGKPESWFGLATYTEGGGVAQIPIGGEIYTGTQLRNLLNLRSTAFKIKAGQSITITTRGYGHRVGMSQYGADAMAVSGSSYAEILAHYYPGTELTTLEGNGQWKIDN